MVYTSVKFQMQMEGECSCSVLSQCNKTQKVIHDPQPSAPKMYPAISSCLSQYKAGERCPLAGFCCWGHMQTAENGMLSPFQLPQHTLAGCTVENLRDAHCLAVKAKTSLLNAPFHIFYVATDIEWGLLHFYGESIKFKSETALAALSVASQKVEVSLCVFQFTFLSLHKCHASNWWFKNANSNFKGTSHALVKESVPFPGRPPAVLFYWLLKIMQ